MVSPVLNEDNIVMLLKAPAIPEATNSIQSGCVQTIIDMWDRKCTREEFIDRLQPALGLYGNCAKLWVLRNIEEVYKTNELSPERFEHAKEQLAEMIRLSTATLIDHVKRMQLCPEDEDKVH